MSWLCANQLNGLFLVTLFSFFGLSWEGSREGAGVYRRYPFASYDLDTRSSIVRPLFLLVMCGMMDTLF